ncbi:AIR synthase [Alkalibaculum sp. M08DMB]|uniref:AIR synthase n=1 Tax=Alkalibaculum sporogenes TaxID=2655001 RepID=A0A6A7K6D0_9FIRM|nr:AIR synthase family protein [Alkalibaculum sporogenes]MPW24924.1 AIR synthase [Alkalibaculum sporogenes]
MEIGKLSNDQLSELIFSKINHRDKRVLVGSGIGEDCSIIDFDKNLCVISSDPITATSNNIGKLGVYVSCNDIASKGVRPFAIMVTVLAPPSIEVDEIKTVMDDIIKVCNELKIELVGGHTEVTDAVNRMVLSITAIGSGSKENLIDEQKIENGDLLLMTKYAGCEGTSILYSDFRYKFEDTLTEQDKKELNFLGSSLSVIEEGLIAAEIGAKYMHDATEGGILGAAWEMAEKSKIGVEINIEDIPILSVTRKITDLLSLDPLKLISSGVMLIVVAKNKKNHMIKTLESNGINTQVIGTFKEGNSRVLYKNGTVEKLLPPETDEIYRAYKIK